jgi:hypothetical protein
MRFIVEFASRPIPACPLKPQISLHWLAVTGAQPAIPENPNIVSIEQLENLPATIPKELQVMTPSILLLLLHSY